MQNTITQEQVDEIFDNSTKMVTTMFDKCTVMVCQLPNGFVLTESSACVDKANYDYQMGFNICAKRIKNKIWELEGYRLQSMLSDNK